MRNCRGFSLIELVVVIVLVGILATGAGMLISRPIDAYNDQLRRQQLVDSAEMALRKITADIRRALPNSIRLVDNSPDSWALEMMNTVDGARYRDDAGGVFNTAEYLLDFAAADNRFNVLGQFRHLGSVDLGALRVVIYNTNPDNLYADAFNNSVAEGIISDPGLALLLNGDEHNITLTNPFHFEFQSPTQRLFLVDGAISYICNNTTGHLTRFDKYEDQSTQITTVVDFPGTANSGRVASRVSSCSIDYQPGSAQRGGLLTLDMSLTNGASESVRLLHQVHVDNVP